MSFESRNQIAQKASDAWIKYCIKNGFHYVFTGYEHWKCSDEFMESMKSVIKASPTWNRLRYMPDCFVMDAALNGYFIDTKSGGYCIEKDAYEFYAEMGNKNMGVSVVVLKDGCLHLSAIEDVVFRKITKIYPGDAPVRDGHWICPRDMNHADYEAWRKKHPGSGTAFGIIDNFHQFEKMKNYGNDSESSNELQSSRYMKSKVIADKFIEFCDSTKRHYAFCSMESLRRSEAFYPTLLKSKDQTCRLMKHFPDMMVIRPDKSGGSLIKFIDADLKIEEIAYEYCVDLDCLGLNVMLVTFRNDELQFCRIPMALIKDLGKSYNGIPVFETRWADPRKLERFEYVEYKKNNPNMDRFGFIEERCFQRFV